MDQEQNTSPAPQPEMAEQPVDTTDNQPNTTPETTNPFAQPAVSDVAPEPASTVIPVVASAPNPVPSAPAENPFGQAPAQPPMFAPNPVIEPMPATAPASSGGMSSGSKVGLIIGGIVLVLAIVGAAVAWMLFLAPPSKDDYQKAYEKTQTVAKDNVSLLTSSKVKDAKTAADVKQIMNSVKAEYDKDNAELSSMRAFRDGDVKKLYDKYEATYKTAMPTFEAQLTIAVVCGNVDRSSITEVKAKDAALKAYDTVMKDCVDVLKGLESSTNADVAAYAKSYSQFMVEMRTYLGDAMAAQEKNDYKAMAALKTPSTSAITSIDINDDKYNFSKPFTELSNLLKSKAEK